MILTSPCLGVFSLRNIVNQSVRNITAGTIRNNMILRRTEQIQKKLDMKEMSLVGRFLERFYYLPINCSWTNDFYYNKGIILKYSLLSELMHNNYRIQE